MNSLKREKQLSNSDLRDTVKVFCRLRPLQDECELPSIKLISPTTLTLSSEFKGKSARKGCNYVFRHVFTSYSGQREVFEHVALPLLEDLVAGKNGLLFTYGVTGSGKTHTLTGDQSSPGIMPSCINTLFNSVGDRQAQKYLIKSDRMNGFEVQSENEALEERFQETKSNKRFRTLKKAAVEKIMYSNDGTRLKNVNEANFYAIFISYTEIYNNAVYDLLDDSNSKILQAKIIREDSQKNMYVNGVEEVEVKSAAEAFELFCMGQKRKRMAHTLLNAESSRSHSIFNIRVVQLVVDGQGDIPAQTMLKIGQLSLVDLAGSERCNRTNNTGIRLKEASSINNSLMTLRTCLETLRENQNTGSTKVIPYRDSRLTLLFKNYFEGEGQVKMIVCINPSEQDCEENLQVLKFAEMTQEVQVTKSEPRYLHQFRTPNAKSTPMETPKTVKTKSVPSLSLGPKIPSIKLEPESPDQVSASMEKILKCLQVRRNRGMSSKKDFIQKEKHLRKRLLDINQESVLTKSEIRNLKAVLKKEKQLTQNLNLKIADVEAANHSMQSKNNELQEIIRTLQLTIDEKNLKLNQNCLEREKNKQKFAIHTEKLNKELDDKLRKQRHQMQIEMQAKDLKLKKMKEIIESDAVEQEQPFTKTIPENANENNLQQTVSTVTTANTRSTLTNRTILNKGRVKTGDVWLEHNAIKPVPLNTVMQPSMKKRKSVDKLKRATDVTNPKQTKYCLIAQEPDNAGDLETKLYKGDIIPTCGGGAQVVFNGVECLREESPTRPPLTPHNK